MGIQYKTLVPDIHNKFVRLPGRLHRLGGFYFAEDMAILCDVLRFFSEVLQVSLLTSHLFLGSLCTVVPSVTSARL